MDPERRQIIHDAMTRLSDGDRSAFPALVGARWPVVLAFARRGWRVAGVGGPDAEDVAQQVFLRICERIAEFDARRDGLSWAFGIASYEMLTLRRRRQRRRETAGARLDVRADPSPSQEEAVMNHELLAELQALAGELTDEDRALLGLGAGTDGAAAATPVALRKRRQRLLDRLRIAWRRVHGES